MPSVSYSPGDFFFPVLCTFSFCLWLLKKLNRKLNLDTQTHIQTTRKKKISESRQAGRQTEERVSFGLALS